MRVEYVPQGVDYWTEFIRNQSGAGINVYSGAPFQRGAGIGSFFRSLFRTAAPILRRAATAATKTAIETGMSTLGDIARGEDAGEAFKRNAKSAAADLLDRGLAKVRQAKDFEELGNTQTGSSLGSLPFKRLKPITVPQTKRKKQRRQPTRHTDIFG